MRFVYDEVNVRRRLLPHWDTAHGLYFITFRLLDAIPLATYVRLERQKHAAIAAAEKLTDGRERDSAIAIAERDFRGGIEICLDEGHGDCVLANPAAARAAHEKLLALGRDLMVLIAHAIMPNHVHVVMGLGERDLGTTMQRIKGGMSFDVNHAVGRTGTLWDGDYYDTLIRDQTHLQNAISYTMNNPTKARLTEWPWTFFSEDGMRRILGM
jgi:putative transposase